MKNPKPFHTGGSLALACVCAVASAQFAFAQPQSPPPRPAAEPLIGQRYANDADGDRVDDRLLDRAQQALAGEKASLTSEGKPQARAKLGELVNVELIFKEPVTQWQLDTFTALGGEITYIYKALSYGWNGLIPLNKITAIPAAMGATLVLLHEPPATQGGLFEATSSGRVRSIWAPGFAGSTLGYSGSTNITIGFSDSGVDANHPDLNGRGVFWNNYVTDESAPSPVDFNGHGTRVAGVALGTGAAGGNGPGPLTFMQNDTLAGVAIGSFVPMPFELPAGPSTVTLRATWSGGTSTSLRLTSYLKGTFGGGLVNYAPVVTNVSPLSVTVPVTGDSTRVFTPQLRSNGSMSNFVVSCTVPNYPATADGFNRQRGVAPGCNWAMAKTARANNSGQTAWIGAALDDMVAFRIEKNIKVINISQFVVGDPGIDTALRQKVNSAVNNGVLVVTIAGNDGKNGTTAQREIDDPGRAAYALTVGAANDNNQLTDYSSVGFAPTNSTPAGQEEDFKPDLLAPDGSAYYTFMTSVDSDNSDGVFADQQPADYSCGKGTSESAPFVSGCAALVIQALEAHGLQWDFSSNQHPLFVKMVLCATASESAANRENNVVSLSPSLQRAAAGPNGFPPCKDPYEGYGMLNPDAGVEAVALTYTNGTLATSSLGPSATDRRAWGRTVTLPGGRTFSVSLSNPAGGDFDLYLYSAIPSTYGTPVLLASSTQGGNGVAEVLNYTPASDQVALLVVKRVAGSGTFSLLGNVAPAADFAADVTTGFPPLTVNFTNLTTGATNYQWTFGDGHTSTDQNPSNTYSTSATYSVTLKAIGPGGTNSLTRTNYIIVTDPPPTVAFLAAPTSGPTPLTVSFSNQSTGSTTYAWDFGDGQSSTDPAPTNTYTNAGLYSVTLTATGTGGTTTLILTNFILVTTPPLPPVADFIALPTNGFVPLEVSFSNLTAGATNYAWDFGDGESSTTTHPTHTFTSAGNYSITLTVIGPGGTNFLSRAAYISAAGQPVLSIVFASETDFAFSFETLPGKTYFIEYKDLVDDPIWQPLQSLPGSGSIAAVTNSIATIPQRFFRLRVE